MPEPGRMTWDRREYERQRGHYLADRARRHPMRSAATGIFAGTWLAGWAASALLLHAGVDSMARRYAIAWLVAYAAFFLCVRVWCNSAHRNRGESAGHGSEWVDADPEGCLLVLAIALASALAAGLFWASGGFAALLEAAFEVAFAGTVVRRLSRTEIVGHWARSLLANTWPQALAALLLLTATAAALQHQAPGSTRFAEAIGMLWAQRTSVP